MPTNTSSSNKDFYFRLEAVKILKNRELFKGEVRFVSLVSTDLVPKEDQTIKVETQLFENVQDGSFLDLGRGKLLYHSKKLPNFLNWSLLIIEDDEDIRKTGKVIQNILKSKSFTSIEDGLKLLLQSQPQALVAEKMLKSAAELIAGVLVENKNDQIGLLDTTFIHKLDNLQNLRQSGVPCGDARVAYRLCYV